MEIIYSDPEILLCVKPAGVLSEEKPGGLPALLRETLGDPGAEIDPVHRLDREAAGLMVYARTRRAAAELTRQITEHTFRKEYLALVHGAPAETQGRMEDLLLHSSRENKTYVVSRERKGVRKAALEYTVLCSREGLSLVRIRLLTGRTHQIRAQFSSRGMPLAGDRRYGATGDRGGLALWSCRLAFAHPSTGERMDFFRSPPPDPPWTGFLQDME